MTVEPRAAVTVTDRDHAPHLGRALTRMRAVVGDDYVITTDDEITRRSRCTIPWSRRCAAVVYPGSTEEVQRLVRIAAEERVALWPFSRGRNWGYGATLAAHD